MAFPPDIFMQFDGVGILVIVNCSTKTPKVRMALYNIYSFADAFVPPPADSISPTSNVRTALYMDLL